MPTTYLINPLTGAPLEVIAGAVSAEDLSAKLGAAHQVRGRLLLPAFTPYGDYVG